ncbi:MAG: metal-dependent phosphohydrolase, partial [Pseudomonadota bacterium]
MFNPTAVLAAAFGDHLAETYLQAFPEQKPQYANVLIEVSREALDHIGTSDALYHNAEHTMIVTLVGQQIILGQQQTLELSPEDWLHYIVALLLHDIGFTRGVCEGDTPNEVVINDAGERVCPPRGASDASLAPYHVDRGRMYVRQRFASSDVIDVERIERAIEYTRFPVPDDPAYANLESEPALVRAAD